MNIHRKIDCSLIYIYICYLISIDFSTLGPDWNWSYPNSDSEHAYFPHKAMSYVIGNQRDYGCVKSCYFTNRKKKKKKKKR